MKGLKSIINNNQNINFNDRQKSYNTILSKIILFFLVKYQNQSIKNPAIMKIIRETSIDHAEDRVTVTRSSIETLNNKYRAKYRRYNQRMHQSSRCYKSKKKD